MRDLTKTNKLIIENIPRIDTIYTLINKGVLEGDTSIKPIESREP